MAGTDEAPREFEGRLAKGKDWREIVAWVGDLPPMPDVAARAIQMVENPETTARELTDVLAKDPALAARILKIANSAMFSRQREITTLNQAIMLIGFKALKGIVVAASVRQMQKSFGDIERLVWENSMCTAMASSVIAKKLGKRYVEEIFLLGLLHNLGQVVLVTGANTRKDYMKVLELIAQNGSRFVPAEEEVFGFAHPLIGALVAKKWNFSAESCQIILHYSDTVDEDRIEGELEQKSAITQLADLLCHMAGIGNPPGYPDVKELAVKVGVGLGFKKDTAITELEQLSLEIKEQFDRERSVYE